MRFGRKGMSGESKSVVAILMVFGVLFLISFIWTSFSQGGGPPTGPDQVIKYYDDLLKGEYGGKKYSSTSLIIVLFIPLITSFSIIWTLARILPVFRMRENRQSAAVLAMGLSIYVVPTMSWMIMQVFPPLLGVSAIIIGVSMLLMAIFIIVSTIYQFGDLKWGSGGGGGDDGEHDDYGRGGGWNPFGRRDRGGEGGDGQASGVRLKEEIDKTMNEFNEGLNSDDFKRIREALDKNEEIKNLTDQQKDILFKKFGRWLNYYIRKFRSLRGKLKPGCGIDEGDRILLDKNIELAEQLGVDILGQLEKIEAGGFVGTTGSLREKLGEFWRAGKAATQVAKGAKVKTSAQKTGPKKELSDEDKDKAENYRDLLYRHSKSFGSYLAGVSDKVSIKLRNKQQLVGVEFEIINDHKDFNKVLMDKIISITKTQQSFTNSLMSPKPAYYGPAGIYSELDKFVDTIKTKFTNLPADVKPTDIDQFINLSDRIKQDVFLIRNLIEKYSK